MLALVFVKGVYSVSIWWLHLASGFLKNGDVPWLKSLKSQLMFENFLRETHAAVYFRKSNERCFLAIIVAYLETRFYFGTLVSWSFAVKLKIFSVVGLEVLYSCWKPDCAVWYIFRGTEKNYYNERKKKNTGHTYLWYQYTFLWPLKPLGIIYIWKMRGKEQREYK